jgi:hypothetical protein
MKLQEIYPTKPATKYVKEIDGFVKEHSSLNHFLRDKPSFIQDLARKTIELKNDPSTDFGSQDILPKTIKVSLYQQVIYCGERPGFPSLLGLDISRRRQPLKEALKSLGQPAKPQSANRHNNLPGSSPTGKRLCYASSTRT